MREIEGIEKVVARLKPHMAEIDAHFNAENARFIELMSRPHDVVGRLLKCHLVVEHYLDRFLSENFGIQDLESAKLGFFNKAMLLPNKAKVCVLVLSVLYGLFFLAHNIVHMVGGEPLGLQSVLDLTHHALAGFAIWGAWRWQKAV